MRAVLLGPQPIRPSTLQADARAALARASSAVWNLSPEEIALEAETGEQPGLYLIAAVPEEADGRDQAQPRLVGFWLSFGAAYLSEGPVGPPDQVPPWIEPLLEVLVEEVWWSNLPYYSSRQREWRMPIVLEWTPPVASRAELAPPGDPRPVVPRAEAPRRGAAAAQPWGEPVGGFSREEDDGEDVWLSDVGKPSLPRESSRPAPTTSAPEIAPSGAAPEPAPPPPKLPAKRSVLCLVEARLQVSARLHRASFQVLSPDRFPASNTPAAWPAWILDLPAGEAAMSGAHRLGPPLELPGDRVGFPATGWLTRGLTLWPHAPSDVQAGRLPDRVVQSKLRGQAAQASTLLLSVIAAVIGVTATLRLIAEPRPQPSEAPAPPAPQPSLSPCSPDHQRFVAELRCQVATMASERGAPRTQPACGDQTRAGEPVPEGRPAPDKDTDLQASFCGLLDREREGVLAQLRPGDPPTNWGEQAVAQACFNVLSHPFDYRLPPGSDPDAPLVASGRLMMRDPSLLIEPLPELMDELRAACDGHRGRAERAVEGAIFATHIGGVVDLHPTGEGGRRAGGDEAGELRRALVGVVERNMGDGEKRCFEQGVTDGLDAAELRTLCGEAPDQDDLSHSRIWAALGGQASPAEPAIQRYASARFVSGHATGAPPRSKEPLWACHQALAGTIPDDRIASVILPWDLDLLRPVAYSGGSGAVRRQLDLDATLLGIEAGQDAGSCWQIVRQTLVDYRPVHPLLGALDPEGWPSEEQQLCGQICASAFRIRAPAGEWLTPGSDLDACLSTTPAVRCPPNPRYSDVKVTACERTDSPGAVPELGRDILDPLALPWNGLAFAGWQRPSPASICAFHLIAQGYIQSGEDGFVGYGATPRQWAGETIQGGNISGSPNGLAAESVAHVSSQGAGTASAARCGYVAAQCFTQALLEVTQDGRTAPYQWRGAWERKVEMIADLSPDLPTDDPAPSLQRDYPWCMLPTGVLQKVLLSRNDCRNNPFGDSTCAAGVCEVYSNVTDVIHEIVKGETGEEKP